MDTSRKRQMDLRLLYGVAYGHTWFGRWDYRFCHGSFGITKDLYEQALQVISSLELDIFTHKTKHRSIKKLICKYRKLSDTRLITMRDLFRFMLNLKFQKLQMKNNAVSDLKPRLNLMNKKEKNVRFKKFPNLAAKLDSRWHVRRLEEVANVVVNALKEKKKCGMSRQEVRDTARLHIGDTGLIDYVLKSMNNVIVGGYVVRREVNSHTGVLEFSLQEFNQDSEPIKLVDSIVTRHTETDMYKDLAYLYQHVLMDSHSENLEFAVRTVLDSKNFTKEWPFNDTDDELLRFVCRVIPLASTESRKKSIGELVVVPLHATIRELKAASEIAMQDTYCAMEKLKVKEIVELEGLDDNEVVFGAIESGSEIRVRGFGVDLVTASDLNYEGGADNWVVNCKCGARDDDGERMVACDLCEVWQHTRCNGIDEDEVVPPLFVCYRCCESIGQQKYPKQLDGMGFIDWMTVPVVSGTPFEFEILSG